VGCRDRCQRSLTLISTDVVDTARDRLAQLLVFEVVHTRQFWLAVGPPLATAFCKSPTNSFFLVSTEITGSPAAIARLAAALM
jgi:hypothetical protein